MSITPTQQATILAAFATGMGPVYLSSIMNLDYSDVYLFLQNAKKEALRRSFDPIPTLGTPFDLSSTGGLISSNGSIIVTPFGLNVDLTTGASVPVIQAEFQGVNVTVPRSITLTSPATQMYAISLYVSCPGTGAAGHTLVITINYTGELGPETITLDMALDTPSVMMETYPLMVIGGSPVTMSSSYAGGATNDPYNISCRIVQMP